MNDLETRYRSALRWYPKPWRDAHQDAVIGTLMDRAEQEERATPRAGEILNLWAHGLAARTRRLPGLVKPTVRDRASTAALALGTVIAVYAIMVLEADPDRYPFSELRGAIPTFGPFTSTLVVVYAVWVIALVLALAGATLAARLTVLATIPLTVAARLVSDGTGLEMRPTWTFLGLLMMLALLAAAGRPVADRRGVPWAAISLTLGVVLIGFLHLVSPGHYSFQDPTWIEMPVLVTWSPIAVGALAAALFLFGARDWAGVALLIGAPWAAVAIFGDSPDTLRDGAILAVVAALGALAPVAVLRVLGFRVRISRA